MSTEENNAIRIKNSSRNLIVSAMGQVFIGLFGYFERKVFIDFLADSFLGMNDLFANILKVLSLAEMGFGSAIVFCLYKPIAENDTEKLKSLLRLLKRAYYGIGTAILTAGVLFAPFVKFIAKSDEPIPGLMVYFLLYLFASAITYFFSYKTALIHADQKMYIVSGVSNICTCVLYISCILTIIFTKSYLIYLVLHIIANLVKYGILSLKADKMYPFLKDRKCQKLEKEEKNVIKRNVAAMIITRFGDIAVGSSDNIIISTFLGVTQVAMYSNYLLLRGTCITFLETITSSISASIGNMCAVETKEYQKNTFDLLSFVYYLLASIICIFLAVMANDIVKILFSPRFVQSTMFASIVVLNIYLYMMRMVNSSFRSAYGLFWANKIKPLIEVAINLIASLVLVQYLGTLGVILGTTISTIVACSFYEPYILFKHAEWPGFVKYIVDFVLYLVQSVVITIAVSWTVRNFVVTGLISLLLKSLVVLVLVLLIFALRYFKSKKIKPVIDFLRRRSYR